MEYRYLGKSGLQVSVLSFGSWVTFSNQIKTDDAVNMMEMAYDAGINFFDNAEVYASGESETIMGQALNKLNWGRDSYCVSSKVFWGGEKPTQRGLSRKHIKDACHAALKRLQVDYLDLFFCHRPDIQTPIEETVRAMDQLIQEGKVLYWGTSEWSATEIQKAHGVAREFNLTPPTMEQPQYNLFHREKVEKDYLPLYEEIGLGTTIWSPLASGILTGKYSNGIPEGSRADLEGFEWIKEQISSPKGQEKVQKAQKLEEVAKELDCSLAQLSLAWCLKNPFVSTVLLGASHLDQLTENLGALEIVSKIDENTIEKIEGIVESKPKAVIDWKA
ncbi:MAG: aldo/keto reductase [Bdellovibrionota bacterium]|nr:aldo/keto reductase [Bdellovibrionota bacterium]